MKKLNQISKNNNGFTLIELLIVVSILGILVVMVVGNFFTSQKRARDAKRKMDLKNIQTALESYYAINNSYPTSSSGIADKFSGGLPKDPITGEDYDYGGLAVDAYCVCTSTDQNLEIAGTGNATGRVGAVCTFATGSRFCVQNLQ